jgi:hypothetical protein
VTLFRCQSLAAICCEHVAYLRHMTITDDKKTFNVLNGRENNDTRHTHNIYNNDGDRQEKQTIRA